MTAQKFPAGYTPMTDDELARLWFDSKGTFPEWIRCFEQAILERIEVQGLAVVPKGDAVNISPERVDEIEKLKHEREALVAVPKADTERRCGMNPLFIRMRNGAEYHIYAGDC
jgi:hypothetical protein